MDQVTPQSQSDRNSKQNSVLPPSLQARQTKIQESPGDPWPSCFLPQLTIHLKNTATSDVSVKEGNLDEEVNSEIFKNKITFEFQAQFISIAHSLLIANCD